MKQNKKKSGINKNKKLRKKVENWRRLTERIHYDINSGVFILRFWHCFRDIKNKTGWHICTTTSCCNSSCKNVQQTVNTIMWVFLSFWCVYFFFFFLHLPHDDVSRWGSQLTTLKPREIRYLSFLPLSLFCLLAVARQQKQNALKTSI